MHKALRGLFFLVGLFTTFAAYSQTGSVRGFVYDKGSGEPVMFANVVLNNTTLGAVTDINGFFTITNVPVGDYRMVATFIGYDSLGVNISVEKGKIASTEIYLSEGSEVLQEVVVSAEREEQKSEVQVAVTQITPVEIKQLPTVGGQPDLAQYLQVLPGVVFTGDQGGQLYIRGGAPIHNKVLLDGMVVYNPFHSIGFFSVFDTDILKTADIYTGGFGAEYGGRISSVMDIKIRDGNKSRLAGKVGASPFGAKLLLEGPLGNKDKNGRSKTSFLLSSKTSYLEQTSRSLYSYVDTAGLPFNYTDIYAKMSVNGNNGTKFNIFAFNFNDQVNYPQISQLRWKSTGFGSNFVLVPATSTTLIQGNFAYSDYGIVFQENDARPKTSEISGFNGGLDFTYFLTGKDQISYGIDIIGFSTLFSLYNAANRHIYQEDFNTEIAGYLKYKYSSPAFLFEPSLRLNYYSSLREFSPEPRVALKWNITEVFRIKASAGLYSQNLIAGNSDRDVVNLFYGFLSGDVQLPKKFEGEDVISKLQKARHAIFGFEYNFTENLDINVEGYVKDFNQLIGINRNKIYPDEAPYSDKNSSLYVPDELRKNYIIEEGLAYGVDFLIKYRTPRMRLWAVYSLGFNKRNDGSMIYAPHYDRRHNVNLVGSYKFGDDKSWGLDVRWNLGSGFPFTQTQGFYENTNLQDGIDSDYTSSNGSLGIIYADLNQGRLPYYHRLDISGNKEFEFSETVKLEINAGITNAYNRKNIFYFDRVEYKAVYQLPILPSVGANLSF